MESMRKEVNNLLLNYRKYLEQFRSKETLDIDNLYEKYKVADGEDKIYIRNQIVEYHLPLILTFLVQKYSYNYEVNPVFDIEDIIQEGNLLLIKCIDKYTPDRGSFSTFLYTVLRKIYYNNGIPNSPVNFKRAKTEQYKKVKKYIDLEYDDTFISKCCEISMKELQNIRPLLTATLSYENLLEQLIDRENAESNNNLIYEDENLSRLLEEENVDTRNKAILNALNKLTDNQRQFIIMKFGLDGNGVRRSKDIVKKIGCHKKYIYEMYKKAGGRLLKSKDLKQVYNLVDIDYDHENKDKTYYLKK